MSDEPIDFNKYRLSKVPKAPMRDLRQADVETVVRFIGPIISKSGKVAKGCTINFTSVLEGQEVGVMLNTTQMLGLAQQLIAVAEQLELGTGPVSIESSD